MSNKTIELVGPPGHVVVDQRDAKKYLDNGYKFADVPEKKKPAKKKASKKKDKGGK